MAELIRNITPNFLLDFLSAEEEENLLWDGEDEDDFVLISTTCIFSRRALARIADYFEETVPLYHDDVFRSHFRMTLSSFETLCQLLVRSDHIPKGNAFCRWCIDPEKQIAVAVWALANQESCRQISDRFNVTMSSVARCIRRVTKALVDLRGDLIQWPRGARAVEVADGFERFSGFPRVIGAVDGCHIPIRTPSEYPQSYLNRLRSHSIILQGTCDHNLLFTDIYVGWPGSVHDARVLRNSPLYQAADDNLFQGDTHLLGDSAYPLQRWLLSPFRDNGHLTGPQINYNRKHAQTRQVIERALGLLKGRWRRLKYIEMENVKEVPSMVSGACVLHNFCLIVDEGTIEEFFDVESDDDHDDDNESPSPVPRPQAVAKRNQMVIFLDQ